MADPTFRGVGVALITLFAPDGSVDVPGTVAHAQRLVDAGVRAVLVAGTTGEAETLEESEREELIAATRDALPDDVTVIAGASGSWARAAAARAVAARKAGADAVLVSPARAGVDQVALFSAVAEAVGDSSRVIGYHNPGPLGVPGIEVSALSDLPIGAVKDSSADPARLLHELSTWDGNVYVGSGALIALAGPVGATGALLAFANAEPETCIAAFGGDAKAQRSLADLVVEVRGSGLRAIKRAAAARYGVSDVLRLALR
ncbi:dihydrodipicolinate synthase family protein [Actinopolymorpha sp. B9G3]|uniref:dihydrodipicolinate synthase family protein n=1 Tax=Actinopolymorpha sp. B9G3 TaxID=3158970 RepID=UPI0032D985C7